MWYVSSCKVHMNLAVNCIDTVLTILHSAVNNRMGDSCAMPVCDRLQKWPTSFDKWTPLIHDNEIGNTTVKPLIFACPLFREFREPNKTAKLKGANINCMPKIGRNCYSISNYMVLIRQNKRGQNNFACKVANFYGSQIKPFYSNDDFISCQTPVCNHVCRWLTACPCTRLSTGLIYQSPVLSWGRRQFSFRPRRAVRHAASPVSIHINSRELLQEAVGDPNARIDIDSVQKLLNLTALKFIGFHLKLTWLSLYSYFVPITTTIITPPQ